MNQVAQQDAEVRKFATVFLTIFALGFILVETIPDKQQAALLAVVFGTTLALIGSSLSGQQSG